MNNTFENEKEGKTLKRLLDRTLHKKTGLNLCSFILKALYPFSYTVYLSCLTIKLGFLLQKKSIEYASYPHSFEILKHTF